MLYCCIAVIVFIFGWKFLSVAQFTTNLPLDFLSTLQSSVHTLEFPDDLKALGFSEKHVSSISSSIPAITFPQLINLCCSDNDIQYSQQPLCWITRSRHNLGYPLHLITSYLTQLPPKNISLLKRYVDELHDWMEHEAQLEAF